MGAVYFGPSLGTASRASINLHLNKFPKEQTQWNGPLRLTK